MIAFRKLKVWQQRGLLVQQRQQLDLFSNCRSETLDLDNPLLELSFIEVTLLYIYFTDDLLS